MTQTVRIQVFVSLKELNDLNEIKISKKLPISTESQMIRYAIQKYLDYENNVSLTMFAMKGQLAKQKTVISSLENRLEAEQGERSRLIKELEIAKINKKVKKSKGN